MKRTRNTLRRRQAGFTLLEAVVSSVILVSMLVAIYGALSSSWSSYGTQSTYAKMQMDARRALERVAEELRMAGRVPNPAPGQPDYPYTFVNGSALGTFNQPARHPAPVQHVEPGTPAFGDCREIAFLIPEDLDGDGLLTSAATGDIEWSDYDLSYVPVTGPDGNNRLERWEDDRPTDVLATYVERVTFDTIDTDPSIHFNEIVVTIYMARPTPEKGVWLQTQLSTTVKMRNTDGLYRDAPSAI